MMINVNVRQPLLLAALTLMALTARQAAAAARETAWDSAAGSPQEMVFVTTGDSIIMRRLSQGYQPETAKMFELIRKADVAFTNFETGVHGFEIPPGQESGGTYMNSPPFVMDELSWAGFDIVSLANNHANDFGIQGLLETMGNLRQSKLVWAGAGESLGLARKPGYLDTPKGRVALIAVTSTFPQAIMAGAARKDMPGRPGISFLRHSTTYTVPQATYDTLKTLADAARNPGADQSEETPGRLTWAGAAYVVGSPVATHTAADAKDLADLVATVKDAKAQADWVVVNIHCHEANGDRANPAEFLVQFAHAMIDAGVDVFNAEGPHVLRGIEVYKGKPIYYSMGNFIFENDLVELQPQDNYDKVGLSDTAEPSEYYSKRSKNDTKGFPADRKYWQSVIAESVFEVDHTLKAIRLHPIALGFGQARSKRGQPYPAPEAESQQIFQDIKALSAPMGTAIENKGGVFTIALPGRRS